tara:strand:- start:244 stop:1335 length:1092 start_codon:yes stop_codon:yes gene_type:complete
MGQFVAGLLLVCVYLSILLLVLEIRSPEIFAAHERAFGMLEAGILTIFAVELIARLVVDIRYFLTWYGAVDVVAILPSLIEFALGALINLSALRVLRLFRFARALKFLRSGGALGGINGRLAPALALTLGLKGVVVAFEVKPWWPAVGDLSLVIGVSGFALAILLGTKLRVVTGRLYAVEDALCRVVGALRDMRWAGAATQDIRSWGVSLEQALKDPTPPNIAGIRCRTSKLEQSLEKEKIGGPNTAGFHRDVEYILHRSLSRTPQLYERYLRYITVCYSGVVIFSVPGLTGFVASILLVYVLGGMYLLIEDMDQPLDFSASSLVSVDLSPIETFNRTEGSLEELPTSIEGVVGCAGETAGVR